MEESLSEKIKRLRLLHRMTQERLGKAVGVTRVAVSKWESGDTQNIKNENLVLLARALSTTVGDLLDEEIKRLPGVKTGLSNVEPGPNTCGDIPLISWVQAGRFCSSPELFQPGDFDQLIPCPKKVGPRTYALRVKGDSMVSDKLGEKSYPEGIIIYVDPDKEITNGCKVVARIHSEEEATFKKYSEDAGRRYLRPLNKDYDPILMDETMHICGVVVGSWMDE